MNKNNIKQKIFFLCVIALVVHIIGMLILQEVLLKTLVDSNIVYWARVSSVISILLTAALMILVLLVMFYAPFWLINFLVDKNEIVMTDYIQSFKWVIYSYIIFELLRSFFIIIYIDPVASTNIGNINFINEFDKSFIGLKLYVFDVSYILVISIIYIIASYKCLDCGLANSFILGLAVLAFFVLLNMQTISKILMFIH